MIITDPPPADDLTSNQSHSLDDDQYRSRSLDIESKENTNLSRDSSLIDADADDDAEERLSLQMSRWAMQIDPDLAQAEESLAIFPTEKQLLTMVENRKRFRARSPEHWAQSCLNARRKSYEIGEHYLTPEQRAQLDAELYPHRPNKRRRNANPLTPSWSIAADR